MDLIYKYSELKHGKIITYPDGQHNVILDLDYFNEPRKPITIKCSIRDFTELEILLCIVAAIESADLILDSIHFAYLFGLRSDRKFELGSCNYVKDVLSPIIESLNYKCRKSCKFLQPHGRSTKYFPMENGTYYHSLPEEFNHMLKIAADQSAIDIVVDSDCYFHKREEIIFFNKRRENGIITDVNLTTDHVNKLANNDLPILIMDDLCDGGATFIAEAKYLRDKDIIKPDRKLYLFIYHGLFTKGVSELFQYFDRIYTTNSYQPYEPDDSLRVIDVWN